MAFDGVPIGISDGLPEPCPFCLGRLRIVRLFCPRNRGRYTRYISKRNNSFLRIEVFADSISSDLLLK